MLYFIFINLIIFLLIHDKGFLSIRYHVHLINYSFGFLFQVAHCRQILIQEYHHFIYENRCNRSLLSGIGISVVDSNNYDELVRSALIL